MERCWGKVAATHHLLVAASTFLLASVDTHLGTGYRMGINSLRTGEYTIEDHSPFTLYVASGRHTMSATIRARMKGGMIEPLEQVDLPDGQNIMVTIITSPSNQDSESFRSSAGKWNGTVDADTLISNIYTDPSPVPSRQT